MQAKSRSLFDRSLVVAAMGDSFKKLNPATLIKNPVMFVTMIGAAVTTAEIFISTEPKSFTIQISIWLWFTVLFANFAEAVAEGRGKAQASALRASRRNALACKLGEDGQRYTVDANTLRKDDIIVATAGDMIAADGEIIEGAATVDESAITGESAPVIREAGGDRSSVTGGTRVLSDILKIRVSANPGHSFLDRMIGLVEGARRQKTPNEIALTILLAALTLIFLIVCVTLMPFGIYAQVAFSVTVLVALLVCLIPTTIGGLLSAIGIAGIDRLVQKNVLAMSGRAVEAAGDIDVLLLDKTGTITLGNRQAVAFHPAPGVDMTEMLDAAQLSSLADETPEGRSIVVLAREKGVAVRQLADLPDANFVAFTAQTRMSGVDLGTRQFRKGAAESVKRDVGGSFPEATDCSLSMKLRRAAALPWWWPCAIPPTRLRRPGSTESFTSKTSSRAVSPTASPRFRAMGIRTVMITGDNPLTAAAIAREAGVDDFLAQATPEDKLALIRKEQEGGRLVAMTGDGTNDAPALAQADVGVAMNTGTQAAKEAGNMVDLDSNPTKLIEVVEIGKQLLMTRGALTTFSIANDVAKYFAIIPAMLVVAFPSIAPLNVMHLASPNSAILSAVIFNALIIILLIPLALRGVRFRPMAAMALLQRNLLVYGLGGIIAPFAGIKAIDLVITSLHLI